LLSGCFILRNGDGDRCRPVQLLVLDTQEAVAHLAGCKVTGTIVIRAGASLDLTPLHEIEEIDGDLVVGPTVGQEEVSLNRVTKITGAVRVSRNPSMRGFFLPRLVETNRVFIEENGALATIALPRIATVHGAIVISDNHGLELVSMGELANVGHELVVIDSPKLTLLEVGRLVSAEAVRIERNPKLPPELVTEIREKGSVR
ncbi:MAG TPA: hypothetical protein VGC41_02550, partial [Kofleriaceae bacterium]